MQLIGVTGWPVSHSRSPALHEAAFVELGLTDWASQLLPIPPEVFDETVRALPELGFTGINVTIPHKEAALALADSASRAAAAIGAANTLTFRANGEIAADNTDAPAIASVVEEAIENQASNQRALVLGAGGSARAAVHALLGTELAEVAIWNRNKERAVEMLPDFAGLQIADDLTGYDLIVNTTPVGLVAGSSPADVGLGEGFPPECSLFVDLVYSEGTTALCQVAERSGIRTVDGLEILVRQGSLSLEIWTGQRPSLEALREAVSAG